MDSTNGVKNTQTQYGVNGHHNDQTGNVWSRDVIPRNQGTQFSRDNELARVSVNQQPRTVEVSQGADQDGTEGLKHAFREGALVLLEEFEDREVLENGYAALYGIKHIVRNSLSERPTSPRVIQATGQALEKTGSGIRAALGQGVEALINTAERHQVPQTLEQKGRDWLNSLFGD